MLDLRQVAFNIEQGPRENIEDAVGSTAGTILSPEIFYYIALVLCDGVGGSIGGEVASEEAIRRVLAYLGTFLPLWKTASRYKIEFLLEKALAYADLAIHRKIKSNPELAGMSTTIVCAVVVNDILHVGWAGDSRCYIYSKGKLRRITKDHSVVQGLIDEGLIDDKYLRDWPISHAINRYLGMPDFTSEIKTSPISSGDVILLCSDGLTDVVTDRQIAEQIIEFEQDGISLKQLPQQLIQTALDAGTTDNVSAVCYQHESDIVRTGAYPIALGKMYQNFKESKNVW